MATKKKTTTERASRQQYGRRVLIGGHFHPDLQKELRLIAVQNDTSLQQLMIEGFNYVLSKYGRPEIAGVMPEVE